MRKEIKIGYEIGTGEKVFIKQCHLVVTGISQLSGKTTCLNALIKRSGSKAIIFKTKIGEKGITEGTIIPPYYKDVFDWEYASELMEAHRKEKLKFERAWIIKYSKGANSLIEFKKNIDEAIPIVKRDLEKNVLITLQAYLDKILPEIQYAVLSNTLDLKEGINIMDLERFKEETQSIIIRSVLKEVLEKEKNTICVIPEAWKYIPQGLGNPVKRVAETFIRQGATNNNYLWVDSQEITSVSKTILKQCSTWVLGFQSELNEIQRTINQLPIPKTQRPTPDKIATLKIGHFFVATPEFTKKIYAQPSWLDDNKCKKVALGKIKIQDIEKPENLSPFTIIPPESTLVKEQIIDLKPIKRDLIEMRNDFFNKLQEQQEAMQKVYSELFNLKNQPKQEIDIDEVVSKVLQKIPTQKIENNGFDKETLINEILLRVPKSVGNITYEVAPLEKIKKDFLEEAKNKILTDIKTLSDDSKKMLKYLEVQNRGVKTPELITKCYLLKDGGSQRKKVSNATIPLKGINAIKKDTAGFCRGILKVKIKDLLENQGATEQEIDNLYNHIIMELLGGK